MSQHLKSPWKFLDERPQTCMKYYYYKNNSVFCGYFFSKKNVLLFAVCNQLKKLKPSKVGYSCRRILNHQDFSGIKKSNAFEDAQGTAWMVILENCINKV